MVITAIVGAAVAIGSAVANIVDADQRRMIESNLSLLSEKEQIALANKIASTKNKNEQALILVNAVMAARNAKHNRQQQANTIMWVLVGSVSIITLGIVAWYLKKK